MDQVNSAISSNLGILAGFTVLLALVVVLLLVALLLQTRRLARLTSRVDGLTRGVDGRSLESVLDAHLETVFRVARDLDALEARATALETAARRHFDRVGLIRFNPFEDTGGNQSFALALLDGSLDGFVVSSLHSRTGTRIYAKSVRAGAAEATLSLEEKHALDLARGQGAARSVARASRITGGRSGDTNARADSTNVRGSVARGVTPPSQAFDADVLDQPQEGADGSNVSRPSWRDTPRS